MLAIELSNELRLPHIVVINRSDVATPTTLHKLQNRLGHKAIEMPFDPALARAYATGQPLLESSPRFCEAVGALTNLMNGLVADTERAVGLSV